MIVATFGRLLQFWNSANSLKYIREERRFDRKAILGLLTYVHCKMLLISEQKDFSPSSFFPLSPSLFFLD